MDRSLAMLAIGVVFGTGIGYVVAASTGASVGVHDHAAHAAAGGMSGADHDHATPVALPLGTSTPTIALALTPDPVSGWNLHVGTENFRFAPESAGAPHVPGEGHAHVYVDGEKIARIYGPWTHFATLPAGATVEVTLNANDHRPLAVHGHTLAATARVPAE